MSCYHPNRVFYTGRTNETGGRETIYQASYLPKFLSIEQAAKKIKGLDPKSCNTIEVDGHRFLHDSQVVPCGKCVGCHLDYSRNWATRIMLEAQPYGDKTGFFTLTYDDEHLPKDGKLCKEDMQKFFKRLRKKYGTGLKIAYAGEHGNLSGRAHYHALIIGINLTDLKPWNTNLSTSESVTKIWGKGNVLIGKLTFNSAAYVARYMLKKPKLETDDTFFIASRRPGLARSWLEKNGDVFAEGQIYVHTDKGNTLKIPKYYRNLLKKEDPYTYEALKTCNSEEQDEIRTMESYAGMGDYEKILEFKEEEALRQQKKVKRPYN